MADMRDAIIPKSDQLNSDDLISGPRTITVREVAIKGGQEQPVSIFFNGDNGKPFKPCKSVSRLLVAGWGADANKYVGRSLTLYRDPKVTWAGMEVGGIRVSEMSDIERPLSLALTQTKGKKAITVVQPLKVEKRAPDWTPYDALKEVADLVTEPDARTMWKRAMALSKADAEAWKPVLEAITARVAVIKADADRATVDTVTE